MHPYTSKFFQDAHAQQIYIILPIQSGREKDLNVFTALPFSTNHGEKLIFGYIASFLWDRNDASTLHNICLSLLC